VIATVALAADDPNAPEPAPAPAADPAPATPATPPPDNAAPAMP
jgi:hypothetical protein